MREKINLIGLICARGGSKGIPNKNIKKFFNKPLIAKTIETIKKSKVIDKIIVSTDSEKIAKISLDYGAEVPGLRPSYLAKDDSDQFETHAYVFDKLDINDENSRVVILVNNPFLSSGLIKLMVDKAKKIDYEKLVIPVIETRHPYYFQYKLKNQICYPLFKKEFIKMPINRQDREPMYFPFFLGCIGKPSMLDSWDNYKFHMTNGFLPVKISKKTAIDIDDKEDWEIAQAVYSAIS